MEISVIYKFYHVVLAEYIICGIQESLLFKETSRANKGAKSHQQWLSLTNYEYNTDLSQEQEKPDNVVLDDSPHYVPQ